MCERAFCCGVIFGVGWLGSLAGGVGVGFGGIYLGVDSGRGGFCRTVV